MVVKDDVNLFSRNRRRRFIIMCLEYDFGYNAIYSTLN